MASSSSSDTIFSSCSDHSSQQRWVNRMNKTILETSEISIYISQSPPSIFKLPQTLISTNPQSYTPRKLALGPYHHFNPLLYKLEWLKLAAAKNIPNRNQIQILLNNLKQLEPRIRTCYDNYLDMETDALTWILVIDSIFLLTELRNTATDYINDILMLENQIPFFVMLDVEKTLELSFDYATLRSFAEANSPLKLKEDPPGLLIELHEVGRGFSHLLDYMYKLMVRNEDDSDRPHTRIRREKFFKDARKILDAAGEVVGLAGAPHVQLMLKFVGSLTCEEMFSVCGKSDEDDGDDENAGTDVAGVPSVSRLTEIAKVNFCLSPKGIRDIKFNKEELTFSLPVINLNIYSEVVLRNLLAYEVSLYNTPGSTSRLELAEYVELMSGIIKTGDDAKLLNEKGIITGDLGHDQVAKMFNGINQSIEKGSNSNKPKSRLGMAIEGANEEYESRPEVKRKRFMNMCGSISWKFLTLLTTIILLALVIFQSFCAIYGCSKLFK